MKDTERSLITRRAFLAGAILSILLPLLSHYSINIVHGSYLAIDHMPAGAISLFFIIVFVINSLLRRIKRSWVFSPPELLTVYIMMLVASSVTTRGFGSQILPMLAAPFYYATPENRWAEIICPHIKPWLVPQGAENIRCFFEGLPKGVPIPWMAWLKPLSVWIPFILVLNFVMICIMVILRKQWVERERLIFPLIRLPSEMVREEKPVGDRQPVLNPFFRSKLMWFGFAIPFLIGSINSLHFRYPFIPRINLIHWLYVFRHTVNLQFRISFPMIGLAYLINLDMIFSLWFFNLLFTATKGLFNITGIGSVENIGPVRCDGGPIFSHLSIGAFLALVLYGLWTSRHHLKNVFSKAIQRTSSIDDSEEILSYRVAFWGLVIGLLLMTGWLVTSGLSLLIAVLFLVGALALFLGLTRVVAEAGVPILEAPSTPAAQIISGSGATSLGPSILTGLSLTYIYAAASLRTFVMCSAAHGLKLSEQMGKRLRPLFWAMMAAITISIIASLWISLKLAYTYGGINCNYHYFIYSAKSPFTFIADKINHPVGPDILGWSCRGIGIAIMLGLTFVRTRFLWWPLHPLGFAIGATHMASTLWFSIFIAWVVKSLILRYGGPAVYRKGLFFFLGLVLGHYTCAGVWLIIDIFTKVVGNVVSIV